MRVVFMGTPPFASTILKALIKGGYEVVGVCSQPDRPKGRGRQLESSDVSRTAAEHNLPVIKPEKSGDPSFAEQVRKWKPDVNVVAAFGLILRQPVLEIPRLGNINVHASLLPKYRGAAPIQDAIIKGETETGITTMLMDEGLDTGDILLQKSIPIGIDTTAGELEDDLAEVGAELILKTLEELEAGKITPLKQDSSLATYSPMLKPEDGYICWNLSAAETHNRIRGFTPRPGARCFYNGMPVRIWRSGLSETGSGFPGEIIDIGKHHMTVVCGDGHPINLLEVQPANKGRMSAADFARGLRLTTSQKRGLDTAAPEQ